MTDLEKPFQVACCKLFSKPRQWTGGEVGIEEGENEICEDDTDAD